MVNTFNAARGSLEAAAYGPLKWIDCFNNPPPLDRIGDTPRAIRAAMPRHAGRHLRSGVAWSGRPPVNPGAAYNSSTSLREPNLETLF